MKYLIDDARQAWKFWSVRLAMLAGVTAGYLSANPDQTQALLDLLPDGPMRVLASAGIGLFVFSLATGARLARQPAKEGE
jgi:hypothetical protein